MPVFDEIILSMSLMNQVLSFDDVSGKMSVKSVVENYCIHVFS